MNFSDSREHESIREAIGLVCADFADGRKLNCGPDAKLPGLPKSC